MYAAFVLPEVAAGDLAAHLMHSNAVALTRPRPEPESSRRPQTQIEVLAAAG